jgi:hypothetical protein
MTTKNAIMKIQEHIFTCVIIITMKFVIIMALRFRDDWFRDKKFSYFILFVLAYSIYLQCHILLFSIKYFTHPKTIFYVDNYQNMDAILNLDYKQ